MATGRSLLYPLYEETEESKQRRMAEKEHDLLYRADISREYLHSNSSCHEFLFGALAEIVDNCSDAGASRLDVYSVASDNVRGKYILCFLDNGHGMSPANLSSVMKFGNSIKRFATPIGHAGIGLKSGSMRIAKDMMVLTKQGTTMSCLFVSRTFLEVEDIAEVIIPVPSWRIDDMTVVVSSKERYKTEMRLICRYSPFRTLELMQEQFTKIPGSCGTMVMVFNVMLTEQGLPELDVTSDPYDIIIRDTPRGLRTFPERWSLRAYLSVLYLKPRMFIYLQHHKVVTKRVDHSLYRPRKYTFLSSRFRVLAEREIKEKNAQLLCVVDAVRDLESRARTLEQKQDLVVEQSARVKLRQVQVAAAEQKAILTQLYIDLKELMRGVRQPKPLCILLGLNVERRFQDGICIYVNGRLIRTLNQLDAKEHLGSFGGVVAVVSAPNMMLALTHNKQDLLNVKELNMLIYAISERAAHYRASLRIDKCSKWRQLPFRSEDLDMPLPPAWVCYMNPDPSQRSCTVRELAPEIKTARFRPPPIKAAVEASALPRSPISSGSSTSTAAQPCGSGAPRCRQPARKSNTKDTGVIVLSSDSGSEETEEEEDAPTPPKRRNRSEQTQVGQREVTMAVKEEDIEAGASRDTDVTDVTARLAACLSSGSSTTTPAQPCSSGAPRLRQLARKCKRKDTGVIVLSSDSGSQETEEEEEDAPTPPERRNRSVQSQVRQRKVETAVKKKTEAGASRDIDVTAGIAARLRRYLEFILVPEYPITVNAIQNMTMEDLAKFPVARLKQAYRETTWRMLMSNIASARRPSDERLGCVRDKLRQLQAIVEEGQDLTVGLETVEDMDRFILSLIANQQLEASDSERWEAGEPRGDAAAALPVSRLVTKVEDEGMEVVVPVQEEVAEGQMKEEEVKEEKVEKD